MAHTLFYSPVKSEMLEMFQKKGSYYFDYVVEVPETEKRRLRTILTMKDAPEGSAGKILLTLTVNMLAKDFADDGVREIIDSFVSY